MISPSVAGATGSLAVSSRDVNSVGRDLCITRSCHLAFRFSCSRIPTRTLAVPGLPRCVVEGGDRRTDSRHGKFSAILRNLGGSLARAHGRGWSCRPIRGYCFALGCQDQVATGLPIIESAVIRTVSLLTTPEWKDRYIHTQKNSKMAPRKLVDTRKEAHRAAICTGFCQSAGREVIGVLGRLLCDSCFCTEFGVGFLILTSLFLLPRSCSNILFSCSASLTW